MNTSINNTKINKIKKIKILKTKKCKCIHMLNKRHSKFYINNNKNNIDIESISKEQRMNNKLFFQDNIKKKLYYKRKKVFKSKFNAKKFVFEVNIFNIDWYKMYRRYVFNLPLFYKL